MKVIALYFDDTVDLSMFPAGAVAKVTNEAGNVVSASGHILTDSFKVAQMPVSDHIHELTGTVAGETGSPQ